MPRQWIAILVGALILFLFTTFGERGLLHIYHLKEQQKNLEREMETIRKENERLKQEIEALRTNREYLEGIARREFGLVKPGEVIYRFMTSSRGGKELQPVPAAKKTPPVDVKN